MNVRAPLIASTLLLSSAASSDAVAYKLYMTDGDAAACAAGDEDKCPQPLRWWRRETVFTLGQVTPGEFALGEVRGLVEEAFDQWIDVDCATTESPNGVIPVVTFGGNSDAVSATRPATAKAEPDNLIVFIRSSAEWQRAGNSSTWIAITKIAHDQSTGEVVDADIEVNDGGFKFSIDGSPAQGPDPEVDFLSMLVHEVGHFYGLDHSLIEDATMFATYSQTVATATAARTIEQDDKEGVCALYTGVPTKTATPKEEGGCHGGAGLGLFGLMGLALARSRRKA
ncbi:MAG TPA: matrixin family metalloprotease [Myxococcota bacterium]|nr:matrixin family metalloprotease [Myxococcota bacterium]